MNAYFIRAGHFWPEKHVTLIIKNSFAENFAYPLSIARYKLRAEVEKDDTVQHTTVRRTKNT